MMHASTFSYARDTEIPPSIVIFFVDGHRRSESLTRTTNSLVSFSRRFCFAFCGFLYPPQKWRMLIIGSAVNNHREPVHLSECSRVTHLVFTSVSLLSHFSCFPFFVFMEALLFAHIEWRSEAHATSYSEWNGLFWK